jgi:hypothetical protein
MFTPPERLEVFEGNPKAHPYVPKAEGGEAALREQARGFHDLFWALYEFRGFLGGAHLVSAGQLEALRADRELPEDAVLVYLSEDDARAAKDKGFRTTRAHLGR